MKKVTAHLGSLMAVTMAMEAMNSNHIEPKKSTPTIPLIPYTKKPLVFSEQSSVIKIIEDYKLIIKGESLKGKFKQARVVSKIDNWIKLGFLTKEGISDE